MLIPASTTSDWAQMPLERGLSRNAATFAASCVCTAALRGIICSAYRYESTYPGIPAEALVFKRPGATALNRTCEKRLKLFVKNASDESSAALIGAIYP